MFGFWRGRASEFQPPVRFVPIITSASNFFAIRSTKKRKSSHSHDHLARTIDKKYPVPSGPFAPFGQSTGYLHIQMCPASHLGLREHLFRKTVYPRLIETGILRKPVGEVVGLGMFQGGKPSVLPIESAEENRRGEVNACGLVGLQYTMFQLPAPR